MEQADSRSCTALGGCRLDLGEVVVRPIDSFEEPRYSRQLMQQYHYLGLAEDQRNAVGYVATWREEWAALFSFSAVPLSAPRAIAGLVGIFASAIAA